MEREKNYKRRNLLVKQSFQLKYVLVISVLFALSALLIWWETYRNFGQLLSEGLITDPVAIGFLKQTGNTILFKLLVTQALVFLTAILVTHFVAGPLYRLERVFETLKKGDFTHRIQFRRFDQLAGLAETFNGAASHLQQKVREDRETLAAVADEIEAAGAHGKLPKEKSSALTKKLKTVTSGFIV